MNPVMAVLCILYILSPIDVLPDVIPFAGWVDDLGVLGYLGYQFLSPKNTNPPQ